MAMEEIKPDDYKGFFPITANFNERTQLFYRKYAAGFMQIAEKDLPLVSTSRTMSWDHKDKLALPAHVILDGFEDLRAPFFDSLGEWGPCMGAKFLKCPPYDPVHCELLRRVGNLFDIDLTCKLTRPPTTSSSTSSSGSSPSRCSSRRSTTAATSSPA